MAQFQGGNYFMKRLIKMLSLLSILLILGSCSSSKNVIGLEGPGYLQFTVRFLPLQPTSYRIFSTITLIDEKGNTQGFFGKDLIEAKMDKNKKYIVKWRVMPQLNGADTGVPSQTYTATNFDTNVDANYITVKLGNDDEQLYPEPY